MIIITYEVLSERKSRFQRWRSTKANMILGCIEPVFWLTMLVLSAISISGRCHGGSCAVGVILLLIALSLL